jgi:hypothetical protein
MFKSAIRLGFFLGITKGRKWATFHIFGNVLLLDYQMLRCIYMHLSLWP